ncbi:MAG: LytR C-terminal domain-containing protein [Candidatus Latescibacterota bacterium]|nr:LytR C-terminal domain-containing protein [Candidatus Latescibacterota bacterium]
MQDKILWLWASFASALIFIFSIWTTSDVLTTIDPVITPESFTDASSLKKTTQIEILNGCGTPQIAARLTDKARVLGLDVINEGNANHFNHLYSLVIHRGGNIQPAKQVAKLLGIPHIISQQTTRMFPLANITVIIGKDFEHIKLFH